MELIKAFFEWLADYFNKPRLEVVAPVAEKAVAGEVIPLPWEQPEWSAHLLATIAKSKLPDLPMADIEAFSPGYGLLSRQEKVRWFAHLIVQMAKHESKWNPNAKLVEDFKNSDGAKVVSSGLMQISIESARGYGFDGTAQDLFNPLKNLEATVMIAEKLIAKDGRLQGAPVSGWVGLSRYWSVIRIQKDGELRESFAQLRTYMRETYPAGKPTPSPLPKPKITRAYISEHILSVMKKDIDAKLRETDGKNRSPRIDTFNKRVGVPMGTPYCASGGWCAIEDACKELGLKNPVPKTASSQSMYTNIPAKYRKQIGGKRGDGAILTNRNDAAHGHYMTVSSEQVGIKFGTYEYNTDGSGGRDGDGAYEKSRTTAGDPLKKFRGFVDIPQWIFDHNGGK